MARFRLPDVVCLQELKAPQDKFPEAVIREAGYGVIWHGQKSWNGVAILSRNAEPQEVRRALPGDPDGIHSRYIEATVDGIVIGCIFCQRKPGPGPNSSTSFGGSTACLLTRRNCFCRELPSFLPGITT